MNGRNVEDVNHDTVLKYIAEGKIGAPFIYLYLIEDFIGPQPLTLSFQLMRNTTKSLSEY